MNMWFKFNTMEDSIFVNYIEQTIRHMKEDRHIHFKYIVYHFVSFYWQKKTGPLLIYDEVFIFYFYYFELFPDTIFAQLCDLMFSKHMLYLKYVLCDYNL